MFKKIIIGTGAATVVGNIAGYIWDEDTCNNDNNHTKDFNSCNYKKKYYYSNYSIINNNPIHASSWFSWSTKPEDYTHFNWSEMQKLTKKREEKQIKLMEYMQKAQRRIWSCRQLPSRQLGEQCMNDLREEISKESMKFTFGNSGVTVEDREKYVKQYGCIAWTNDALECIKGYSPIIELGAGQGLWAKELKKRYGKEINIVAFDNYSSPVPHVQKADNVIFGNENQLLEKKYKQHTLFLCYPPLTQDSDLGIKCLNMYKGDVIIYCGEGRRGSNCSEEFFDILEKKFTIKKVITLKPFADGAEKMFILERKKSGKVDKVEETK